LNLKLIPNRERARVREREREKEKERENHVLDIPSTVLHLQESEANHKPHTCKEMWVVWKSKREQ
jgi:hypothetical protein